MLNVCDAECLWCCMVMICQASCENHGEYLRGWIIHRWTYWSVKEGRKMVILLPQTFVFNYCKAFGQVHESCWSQKTMAAWVLLACLWPRFIAFAYCSSTLTLHSDSANSVIVILNLSSVMDTPFIHGMEVHNDINQHALSVIYLQSMLLSQNVQLSQLKMLHLNGCSLLLEGHSAAPYNTSFIGWFWSGQSTRLGR